MRLTVIHNGQKRTIFARGGFGLLEIVLETDIGRCASENDGPPKGRL